MEEKKNGGGGRGGERGEGSEHRGEKRWIEGEKGGGSGVVGERRIKQSWCLLTIETYVNCLLKIL